MPNIVGYVLTAVATLSVTAIVAGVTQLVTSYSSRKVQDVLNGQNKEEHERINKEMANKADQQAKALENAVAEQRASNNRLEGLLTTAVEEHKATNELITKLIGTASSLVEQNKNMSDQIKAQMEWRNFTEARLRDLERDVISISSKKTQLRSSKTTKK